MDQNRLKPEYHVLGIMSGTSLDGLDLAYTVFKLNEDKTIDYSIEKAVTLSYDSDIIEKLSTSHLLPLEEFLLFHNFYGDYIGKKVDEFCKKNNISVDFIASHGHTVFHQPTKKFTFQIGSGASICAKAKKTTISDFRSLDVALSGNGAPLVPIGDLDLFPEYKYCLNLGGFSNISIKEKNSIIAYDIGVCNLALNYLANSKNMEYDKNGEIAQQGSIHKDLLEELNSIPFFKNKPPKSLGREWFEKEYKSVLDRYNISIEKKLRTIAENITIQIAKQLDNRETNKVLVTGGGAHNTFLIHLLLQKTKNQIIIPETKLIDYKEALIFAYLGLLTYLGIENTLRSVTGATKDSIGGIIHYY